MGISLISELEPKNSGSFALLDDKYLRGGLRVVETHNDLATIPTDRLKDGMLAMVTTPAKVLYIYNQPTNTWSLFSAGGEGGSAWSCVGDNETIKITQNIDDWTQTISAINNIRTYEDYSVLPTEDVVDNEVAYCKADAVVGLTTYKRGFYYYELSSTSWVEVNSTIEIDSALSETSKRPVQNRVVTKALDEKISKNDVDNVISKHSSNPVENRVIATALENVKASKTMTAEEYGALDDETKNDGSFYYISDTGEIYQNGIIYGGKQIFDVTQEEYDALTDEEKAVNEYHCTDTGRVYINGILYGDKKPIELTFEEYKQLEADGKVEADVDYVIVSNESGVLSGFLLSDIDTNHGSSNVSTYEVIETLKSDVDKKAEILDSEKNDVNTWSSNKIVEYIDNKAMYISDESDTYINMTTGHHCTMYFTIYGNTMTIFAIQRASNDGITIGIKYPLPFKELPTIKITYGTPAGKEVTSKNTLTEWAYDQNYGRQRQNEMHFMIQGKI